jgi:hypothetical protein
MELPCVPTDACPQTVTMSAGRSLRYDHGVAYCLPEQETISDTRLACPQLAIANPFRVDG